MERTLLIIKPDAFHKQYEIRPILLFHGFVFSANSIQGRWHKEKAEGFYYVHRAAPFFEEHIRFMCSGTSLAMVLERDNAVARLRELVGATDPTKAAPGTLRAQYGTGLPQNAVHASDSVANAEREIAFLFTGFQLGQVLD